MNTIDRTHSGREPVLAGDVERGAGESQDG
jgi:hypothetical protein